MNENHLLSAWSRSGNILDALYDALDIVTNNIRLITVDSSEIKIFTVNGSDTENLYGFLHSEKGTVTECIPKNNLKGFTDELINEAENSTLWMINIRDEWYSASRESVNSLGIRAKFTGDSLSENDSRLRFYRDGAFVSSLNNKKSLVNVVYREENGVKKIFYFGSEIFAKIPQKPVIKNTVRLFEKEMGKSKLGDFRVSNYETSIYFEYPEKAEDFRKVYNLQDEIIPGLQMYTSDIGESSYIVQGTIKIDNSVIFIPSARYIRQHTKNADIDEIIKMLEKNVFPEYTVIPERLVELSLIDISDPATIVANIADSIDTKTIGKKAVKKMKEEILDSLNPNVPYTAYDISMLFINYGTELEENLESKTREALAKIRGISVQAIFYKYENC